MKRKQFSEEQMVRILKEAETGTATIGDVCRKYGISEFTFYRWRRRFQGLTVSEAKRLRELEKENGRLKSIVANRDLEIEAMKELLRKNS
ncbi:MAG: transposase [candidate division KSB1 bacterium]|nr:transposase [candidate division KSB1 bacterium]